MTSSSQNEYKLSNPPDDGISSLNFSPSDAKFLLTTSWDSTVRLYDVMNDKMRFQYDHQAPVLDACFSDAVNVWSCDLSGNISTYNINTGTQEHVGSHNDAVRCIEYCEDQHLIVTSGWDSMLNLWDVRSHKLVGSHQLPSKAYTMAMCGHRVIVGTAGKHVCIFDLRNTNSGEEQRRESSLKYQTRCIRAFPNQQGYVLSSIEGRVAVEYLDPAPEEQKKKYAFKSHRVKENGKDYISAVHAIAFHKEYNTFATGGADCYVNMWDGFNKKRLCQFHRYPAPVSALAFSGDGSSLAIGCSTLYSCEHDLQKNMNALFIHQVNDSECKPRTQ